MKKTILATAALCLGLAAGALPTAAAAASAAPEVAQASQQIAWNQALGPRQIRHALAWQGYRHIDIVDRRGRVYLVKAEARNGHRYMLVVDSRNGRVIDRHRLGRHPVDFGGPGPGWHSGGGGPGNGGPGPGNGGPGGPNGWGWGPG
jgi:hypothetical protein